uniref:Uncharacterized protein n=1 Tax=Gadus morhua TaxID=8049 RepID=A0A8C5A1E1_GADMO
TKVSEGEGLVLTDLVGFQCPRPRVWGGGYLSLPMHKITLETGLVSGEVAVAVCLPIKGVSFILGNDLAGGRVFTAPEVVPFPVVSKRPDDLQKPNQKILGRLQVQRLLRRMRKERRFLMNSYLTIHLEDESTVPLESATGQEGDRINGASGSSGAAHHGAGPKKRRHRIPKVSRLAQGLLGTQLGIPGIELATFWLRVNPLYLLSYCHHRSRTVTACGF